MSRENIHPYLLSTYCAQLKSSTWYHFRLHTYLLSELAFNITLRGRQGSCRKQYSFYK